VYFNGAKSNNSNSLTSAILFSRILLRRRCNLKLNSKNCRFFQKRVTYLGHVVSEDGVSTDPEKTKAVSEWPVPKNVKG
jgi:hypothetical protein